MTRSEWVTIQRGGEDVEVLATFTVERMREERDTGTPAHCEVDVVSTSPEVSEEEREQIQRELETKAEDGELDDD